MNINREVTIGELIVLLRNCKKDADIYLDFPGYPRPTCVSSYRGCYNMPALEFVCGGYSGQSMFAGEDQTVEKIIKVLEEAIDGRTFKGWKGGNYRFTKDQPLHVANLGDTSDVLVVGVVDDGYRVVI